MTANPIELIGGLATNDSVVKPDIVAWAKARVSQVLGTIVEIRSTVLANQLMITVRSNGTFYYLDAADTTTPDDGINCVISVDGKRFKPLSSIPIPTTGSLGGVYSSAGVANQYVVGLDTSGNLLRAQPSVTDLSEGNTGTGAAVRATGASLATPSLGVATATSLNGNVWTVGTGTLTLGAGKTLNVANSLSFNGTDGTTFALPSVSGTIATIAASQALTNKSYNGLTLTPTTATLTLANGKTLTVSNTLTFTGTDGSSVGLGAGGTVVYTTNKLSAFAATTSAELAGVISDETGSGALVFANSPVLIAPTLGAAVGTSLQLSGLTASQILGTDASKNLVSLSAATATALLSTAIGDSGSGGTKGLVPAPGAGDAAAAKVLGAGMTWISQTGGGGSYPDDARQNLLLSAIYQSKMFADIRRVIMTMATGFKASTDTLRGILAGSSSNYDTTNSASGGYIAPTFTGGVMAQISTSGKTLIGSLTSGGGIAAAFDGVTNQATSASAQVSSSVGGYGNTIGVDWGSGTTKTVSRFSVYAPNDANIGPGSGPTTIKLQGSPDNATWTDLYTTGSVGTSTSEIVNIASGIVITTAYRYHRVNMNGNGSQGMRVAEVQFFETTPIVYDNMTLVSLAQTSDATVSSARVLLEIDNLASPTLNTDLTVEVTCNGGTNWTSASLSSVGTGQSGRKVVETVDQAATGGTSFAGRIKTLTGKNIPIHGMSITVH